MLEEEEAGWDAGLRWAVARAIGDGIARFAHRRKRLAPTAALGAAEEARR